VAEFAILAPFFVALIVGAFELSRGLWTKEILSDAARRACRTGSQPNASNATIISDVNNILTDNNIDATKATITILVNDQAVDASTAQQNDKISVKVAIPTSATKIVTAVYLTSGTITSETVVMMRYN
jgi:Flp pilus assembly protein TadG